MMLPIMAPGAEPTKKAGIISPPLKPAAMVMVVIMS